MASLQTLAACGRNKWSGECDRLEPGGARHLTHSSGALTPGLARETRGAGGHGPSESTSGPPATRGCGMNQTRDRDTGGSGSRTGPAVDGSGSLDGLALHCCGSGTNTIEGILEDNPCQDQPTRLFTHNQVQNDGILISMQLSLMSWIPSRTAQTLPGPQGKIPPTFL